MSEVFGCQEIVLSFGDTQLTGKKAVISSFEIRQDNNIDSMYGGKSIGGGRFVEVPKAPEPMTISLEMKVLDYSFIDLMMGGKAEQKKISQKKVDDCSISELLFAIREKVKNGKKQT